MSELRSEIRKARAQLTQQEHATAYKRPHPDLDPNQSTLGPSVKGDPSLLKHEYNILGTPFFSHRRILGRGILLLKNFSRDLFSQILFRQITYNAANMRLVTHLAREIESLKSELSKFSQLAAARPNRLASRVRTCRAVQSFANIAKHVVINPPALAVRTGHPK